MTLHNKLIIIVIVLIIILLILPYLNKGSYFSAVTPTDYSSANENNQNNQNNNTIVLIFFADWCGYCKKAKPTFDKLANDYPNKVQLIDSDKNKDLLSKYSVKSFPTIMTNTGDKYESNDRSYESLSQFINNY